MHSTLDRTPVVLFAFFSTPHRTTTNLGGYIPYVRAKSTNNNIRKSPQSQRHTATAVATALLSANSVTKHVLLAQDRCGCAANMLSGSPLARRRFGIDQNPSNSGKSPPVIHNLVPSKLLSLIPHQPHTRIQL